MVRTTLPSPSSMLSVTRSARRSWKRISAFPVEQRRLGELAAARRAEVFGVSTQSPLGAGVRVLAPLGLVAGEGGELALDRLADVDEPVRHEPVAAGGRPLCARGRRVREPAAHRV